MRKTFPGKRRLEVWIGEAVFIRLKGVSAMNQLRMCDLVEKALHKYLNGNSLASNWPVEYHRDFREKYRPPTDPVKPTAPTQGVPEEPDFARTHTGEGTGMRDGPSRARVATPKKAGPAAG